MSLRTAVKQQFYVAAQNDPSLNLRPTVPVKMKTLEQVLAPMRNLMVNDASYVSRDKDIRISDQIDYLRQICMEAQVAHTTKDPDVKKDRMRLLNTLQSMLERVREAEDA
ncbi:MAG: hypothetical protein ACRBDL_00675 [Alphaproteobacteria bacterium]